ncbi:MAG TPA: hypothetical protein VLE48_08380 [Terriglobales bacterium]|nr:hypothetical protein [Terriglobales bacterium]
MGRALGFVGILIVVGVGFYIFTRQAQNVAPAEGGSPRATIDLAGVKNDLVALANAERRHFATEGKYVSIDELRSAGDISMATNRRGPYEYTAEVSDSSFRIVATHTGPPEPGVPRSMSIDDTMQIRTE